jgi:hypothetical protein
MLFFPAGLRRSTSAVLARQVPRFGGVVVAISSLDERSCGAMTGTLRRVADLSFVLASELR